MPVGRRTDDTKDEPAAVAAVAAASVEDRVLRLCAEHFAGTEHLDGPGSVTLDADLARDLGADSLDDVEVVIRLEEEFGIEIDDDACEAPRRVVSDYVALVRTKLAPGGEG